MPKASTRSEYCRLLFREAAADTPTARHTYLDTLATAAMQAQTEGKTLTATASGGSSASFMVFSSWSPQDVIDLVAMARAWADEDTIEDALATIAGPVRSHGFIVSSAIH